jgi:hypothetical protein
MPTSAFPGGTEPPEAKHGRDEAHDEARRTRAASQGRYEARRALIASLCRVIDGTYKTQPETVEAELSQSSESDWALSSEQKQKLKPIHAYQLEHDPVLRRRTEAVNLLGRFPDVEAVRALEDLLLNGEARFLAPIGRWLRDSALLSLLRGQRLPVNEVNRTLWKAYFIGRHLNPLHWDEVYDDVPLLTRYHKMTLFFTAFWVWPLLLLSPPTLFLVWQLLARPKVEDLSPLLASTINNPMVFVPIVLAMGLEIYLVHHVLIIMLAGRFGPLLRLPTSVTPEGEARWGRKLALVISAILLFILVVYFNPGRLLSISVKEPIVLGSVLLLPLLLLPLYMLTHDVAYSLRYASHRERLLLGNSPRILGVTTAVMYIFMLPLVELLVWSRYMPEDNLPIIVFLIYLFCMPIIEAYLLSGLSQVVARLRERGSAPKAGRARGV